MNSFIENIIVQSDQKNYRLYALFSWNSDEINVQRLKNAWFQTNEHVYQDCPKGVNLCTWMESDSQTEILLDYHAGPWLSANIFTNKSTGQTFMLFQAHHIIFDGMSFVPWKHVLTCAYNLKCLPTAIRWNNTNDSTSHMFEKWSKYASCARSVISEPWSVIATTTTTTTTMTPQNLLSSSSFSSVCIEKASHETMSWNCEFSVWNDLVSELRCAVSPKMTVFKWLFSTWQLACWYHLRKCKWISSSLVTTRVRHNDCKIGCHVNVVPVLFDAPIHTKTTADVLRDMIESMVEPLDMGHVVHIQDTSDYTHLLAHTCSGFVYHSYASSQSSDSLFSESVPLEQSGIVHPVEVWVCRNSSKVTIKYNPLKANEMFVRRIVETWKRWVSTDMRRWLNPHLTWSDFLMCQPEMKVSLGWSVGPFLDRSTVPATTMSQLLIESLSTNSARKCVSFGEETWTFDKLSRFAHHVAFRIRHHPNFHFGMPVGVYIERSCQLVGTIVGVVISGACYCALPTTNPIARTIEIVQNAKVAMIITCQRDVQVALQHHFSSSSSSFSSSHQCQIQYIGSDDEAISNSTCTIETHPLPSDVVYMVHTSGSSGKPKTIAITHESEIDLICQYDQHGFGIRSNDVVLQTSPVSFDPHVYQILTSIAKGAHLIMICDVDLMDANALLSILHSKNVSWMATVPVVAKSLVEQSRKEQWNSLRVVCCGGEAFPRKLYTDLQSLCPQATLFVNLYGPAECTDTSTYFASHQHTSDLQCFGSTTRYLPIGKPLPGRICLIIDPVSQLPCPVGVEGELWIGGVGIMKGYVNHDELTQKTITFPPVPVQTASFIPASMRFYKTGDLVRWQEDGYITFLGRIDFQVKIRGQRIETQEIENVLQTIGDIQHAVILEHKSMPDVEQLVAIIDSPTTNVDVSMVHSLLKTRLPHFMLPARYYKLQNKSFPLNSNGKIDRSQLTLWIDTNDVDKLHPCEVNGRQLDEDGKHTLEPESTDLALRIMQIWQRLLPNVTVPLTMTSSFSSVGGHSMILFKLKQMLQSELNVCVTIDVLTEHDTIMSQARWISHMLHHNNMNTQKEYLLPPLIDIKQQEQQQQQQQQQQQMSNFIPATYAQQRIYFHSQQLSLVAPHVPNYLIPFEFVIQSDASMDQMVAHIRSVLDKHGGIRMCVSWDDDANQLVQRVIPTEEISIYTGTHPTLRPLHEQCSITSPIVWHVQEQEPSQSSGAATACSITGVRNVEKGFTYRISGVVHHIVSDGVTIHLLQQYLVSSSTSATKPSFVSYPQYAHWEHAHIRSLSLNHPAIQFWHDYLQMRSWPSTVWKWIRPTSTQTNNTMTTRLAIELNAEERNVMQHLVQQCNSKTLFPIFISIWIRTIALFIEPESHGDSFTDVAVLSTFANRIHAETQGTLGCFVNTLVFRERVNHADDLLTMCTRSSQNIRNAISNGWAPIERVRELESLSQARSTNEPLSDIMITMFDAANNTAAITTTTTTTTSLHQASMFDLNISADTECRVIHIESKINSRWTPERLAILEQTFRDNLSRNTSNIVNTVNALSSLQNKPPSSPQPYPLSLSNVFFEKMTKWCSVQNDDDDDVTKMRHAISDGKRTISYRELAGYISSTMQKIQSLLGTTRLAPNTRVGICMNQSIELVVSLLAVWSMGLCYVALPHDAPTDRLVFLIQNLHVNLILVHHETVNVLPSTSTMTTCIKAPISCTEVNMNMNMNMNQHACVAQNLPTVPIVTAQQECYIVHTSGSTGKPKSIATSYHSLFMFLDAKRTHENRVLPTDVLLQASPTSFDLHIANIVCAIMQEAHLVIVQKEQLLEVDMMNKLDDMYHLTYIHMVPSLAISLLDQGWHPRSCRLWAFGGEAAPLSLLRQCHLTNARVFNSYGPAEVTITSMEHEYNPQTDVTSCPIGQPLPHYKHKIIYSPVFCAQPRARNLLGFLWLSGPCVMNGYVNEPELTNKVICVDEQGDRWYNSGDLVYERDDGEIVYVGRKDFQVKLRGQRIELGEIESVIQIKCSPTATVQDAMVLKHETRDQLIAVIKCATTNRSNDEHEISHSILMHCQQYLPAYMVPSRVLLVHDFPLNRNGKKDRAAMQKQMHQLLQHGAPSGDGSVATSSWNHTEQLLLPILESVLQITPSHPQQDLFYDLGAHSLKIASLASRIRRQMHVPLVTASLMQHSRIDQLASYIEHLMQLDSRNQNRNDGKDEEELEDTLQTPAMDPLVDSNLLLSHHHRVPATYAQQRIYFHSQQLSLIAPHVPNYLIPFEFVVQSDASMDQMVAHIRSVLDKHGGIRMCVSWDDDANQLVQRVIPTEEISIYTGTHPTLRPLHEQCSITSPIVWHVQEREPLQSSGAATAYMITGVLHHIVSDGITVNLLKQYVTNECDSCALTTAATATPASYIRYALWEHTQIRSLSIKHPAMQFWNDYLQLHDWPYVEWRWASSGTRMDDSNKSNASTTTTTTTTTTISSVMEAARANKLEMELCQSECAQMRQLIHQTHSKTPFPVFMALWIRALCYFIEPQSNHIDVPVMCPFANRVHSETEGTLGCFVNTLAIREKVPLSWTRETSKTFLSTTVDHIRKAIQYGWVPLERMKESVDCHSKGLFSDIMITSFENASPSSSSFDSTQTSMFDLVISADSDCQRVCIVSKADSKWTKKRLEYLVQMFQFCLAHHHTALLSPAPTTTTVVVETSQQPETRMCDNKVASCVETWRREKVFAAKTAISHGDTSISFQTLAQAIFTWRTFLESQSIHMGPGQYVGVCMDQSIDLAIAMMTIWSFGACYVALPHDAPPDRLNLIVANVRVSCVLIQKEEENNNNNNNLSTRFPSHIRVIPIDTKSMKQNLHMPFTLASTFLSPSSLCLQVPFNSPGYIVHTSGSTGMPKSIVIPFGAMMEFVNSIRLTDCEIRETDVCLQASPTSFDMHVYNVLYSLVSNAHLVMCRKTELIDVEYMQHLSRTKQLSYILCVPSLAASLLEQGWRPNHCRRWILIGEALQVSIANMCLQHTPLAQIINGYGPAEVTLLSTTHTFDPARPYERIYVPIGKPLSKYLHRILASSTVFSEDDDCEWGVGVVKEPSIPNRIGYLWLSGPCVMNGYANQASHSLPSDRNGNRWYSTGDLVYERDDGEIVYVGRKDFQVKLRGQRIELGEIESVIRMSSTDVLDVVVLKDCTHDQLVAMIRSATAASAAAATDADAAAAAAANVIVPHTNDHPLTRTILQHCQAKLAQYMIPQRIYIFSAFPLNANGKIDRSALQLHMQQQQQQQQQQNGVLFELVDWTKTETQILPYIETVLRVKPTHPENDLFRDLGAHSLKAAQLASLLKRNVCENMSVAMLFQFSQIRALAKAMDALLLTNNQHSPHPKTQMISVTIGEGHESEQEPLPHDQPLGYSVYTMLQCMLYLVLVGQWSGCISLAVVAISWYFRVQDISGNLVQTGVVAGGSYVLGNLAHLLLLIGWRILLLPKHKHNAMGGPTRYSSFGWMQLRLWFLQRQWRICTWWLNTLVDTPLWNLVLCGMGVRFPHGWWHTRVATHQFDCWTSVCLGAHSYIQSNVSFHSVEWHSRYFDIHPVWVGDSVLVGAHSVLDKCRVGTNVWAETQTAVHGDIATHSHVHGSPMQRVDLTVDTSTTWNAWPMCLQVFQLCWMCIVWWNQFIWSGLYASVLVAIVTQNMWLVWVLPLLWSLTLGAKALLLCVAVRVVSSGPPNDCAPLHSWRYFRRQWLRLYLLRVGQGTIDTFGFTRFVSFLMRVAGLIVGHGVEMAGPWCAQICWLQPECSITLHPNVTVTSRSHVGEERVESGQWILQSIVLHDHVFVGNFALVRSGTIVPPHTMLGVHAVADRTSFVRPDISSETQRQWVCVGNPCVRLSYQHNTWADSKEEAQEAKQLTNARRLVYDWLPTVLSSLALLAILAAEFNVAWFASQKIDFGDHGHSYLFAWQFRIALSQWVGTAFGFALVWCCKHALVGSFTPGKYAMFSGWYVKRAIMYSIWAYWITWFGEWFVDSAWMNMVLRGIGCTIGRQTRIIDSSSMLEMDILEVGDHTIIESDVLLQPHTFENRIMTCAPVKIDSECVVEAESIVLAGARIFNHVRIKPVSVVNKGDEMNPNSVWSGALIRREMGSKSMY